MKPQEEYIAHYNSESGQASSIQDINKSQFNNLSEINNLDKVRDILFGNQMREVERKFARLEERLIKECTNLRDENRKRLDSLESYFKTEISSLAKQVNNEQGERGQALKALTEQHKNITISLENKLAQFEEKTINNQREMREQILNQSKNLHDDIRQKYEEILAALERDTQELRKDKTDRSTLAQLFTELAIRLNQQ
jgi:Fe2+ transport system protein B